MVGPQRPDGVAVVAEERSSVAVAGVAVFQHPGWTEHLPRVRSGITAGADMSLFGGTPAREVVPRWLQLCRELGADAIVHARQVHEAEVLVHDTALRGLLVADDADGHATSHPRTLLTVSVADCVPIYLAADDRGSAGTAAVALLHGGWRGVAAGILERGIAVLHERFGVAPRHLRAHFGPAICGTCFEVGPEVPPQLGMHDMDAAGPVHVDLRALLAARAIAAGVPARHVTISAHCTRCGDSPFYSHRGGCAERQVALLGIAPH
jgi:polyphenol oxidase